MTLRKYNLKAEQSRYIFVKATSNLFASKVYASDAEFGKTLLYERIDSCYA
jgi:hypothetical protein